MGWDFNANQIQNDNGATTIKPGINIDREHAKNLGAERLSQPGLLLEYADGEYLIIDGNHRAARLYMDGVDSMQFYLIRRGDLNLIKL